MKMRILLRAIWLMPTLGLFALPGPTSNAAENAGARGDRLSTSAGDVVINPINHATLELGWNNLVILVDPVGGVERFRKFASPNLILLTDIHGDHFNVDTLKALSTATTRLVGPAAVVKQLPSELQSKAVTLTNGASTELLGVRLEAIAAYNTSPDRTRYHPKGRGNGYVLGLGGKRIYISGDTEDTPEARALKEIDVAFLCMNLPYTMTVQQAAQLVRQFRPKVVYPYHCRGSDLREFERLVGSDVGVEVRIRDWYQP